MIDVIGIVQRMEGALAEGGKVAVDAANLANKSVNQMAATAVGGLSGLAGGAAEVVRTGDVSQFGPAFRGTMENATARTTLPEAPLLSDTAEGAIDYVLPFMESAGTGAQEMVTNTGKYWEEATGSTTVGGITAALAAVSTDVVEMAGRVSVPKPKTNQIIAGPSQIDSDTIIAAESDRFNGADNKELIKKHGVWQDAEGQWRKWIDSSDAKLKLRSLGKPVAQLNGTTKSLKVGDILDSKNIYAAYPELKDMDVDFVFDSNITMDAGDGSHGIYSRLDNATGDPKITVFVNPNAIKVGGTKTLLHELQHVVQDIEGLRGGTNADYAGQVLKDTGLDKKKETLEAMLEDYYASNDMELSDAEVSNIKTALEYMDKEKLYRSTIGEKESKAAEEIWAAGLTGEEAAQTAAKLTTTGMHTRFGEMYDDKDMAMFLHRTPSLWGRPNVLKYITDDPKLLKEYGDPNNLVNDSNAIIGTHATHHPIGDGGLDVEKAKANAGPASVLGRGLYFNMDKVTAGEFPNAPSTAAESGGWAESYHSMNVKYAGRGEQHTATIEPENPIFVNFDVGAHWGDNMPEGSSSHARYLLSDSAGRIRAAARELYDKGDKRMGAFLSRGKNAKWNIADDNNPRNLGRGVIHNDGYNGPNSVSSSLMKRFGIPDRNAVLDAWEDLLEHMGVDAVVDMGEHQVMVRKQSAIKDQKMVKLEEKQPKGSK
jgi:hypothetical protein